MAGSTLTAAASTAGVSDTDPAPAKASEGPRLTAGTLVNGRYVIGNVLGEGGMGTVYRAEDKLHPQRQLALKTVRAGRIRVEHIDLFKAEFATMATLRHPNLATVYDFEPVHGSDEFLFTMDFVDGEDAQKATEGADLSRVLELLVQTARCLAYVHSRRLIHLDIKPANVMIDRSGTVKLLDFGVTMRAGMHGAGNVLGTPAYMAPEVLRREETVDHRADLYSLGIMLYQLLCRRLPFDARSATELLYQQLHEPVTFSAIDQAAIPEWLRALVLRLCAKQPAERFVSANAVIEQCNRAGYEFDLETRETAESYLFASRFVGREDELGEAKRFVDARLKGIETTPPALFVAGSSGLGKSRLVRELRQHVQLSRLSFVEGNCYEAGLSEYGPIAEIALHLSSLLVALGEHALLDRFVTELAIIEPRIAALRGLPAAEASGERSGLRTRVFDQVIEFLVASATRIPYVMYVNDLQWAQPATLEILGRLVRRAWFDERQGRRVRFALLGSYRDDEVGGEGIRLLSGSLGERQKCRTLTLAPLSAAEVRTLLSSMLGNEELPAGLSMRLALETGGNPFFIEEVMRALVERGTVYLNHGTWAAADVVGEIELPASMPDVFRWRTQSLEAVERHVLEALAIYGRPIAAARLAKIVRVDEASLRMTLRTLLQRQLAAQVGTDAYATRHDRVRESMRDLLDADKKRALHLDCAAVLPDEDAYLYELAYHYFEAGERDRALAYNRRAAALAERTSAFSQAVVLLKRVFALLDAEAHDERAALHEEIGDLCRLAAQTTEAREHYQAALSRRGQVLEVARLRRKIAETHVDEGHLAEVIPEMERNVVALGGKLPATRLRQFWMTLRSGYSLLGSLLSVKHRARVSKAEGAVANELGAAYATLSRAYHFHTPKRALPFLLHAIRAGLPQGDSRKLAQSYAALSVSFAVNGYYRLSQACARHALAMAERLQAMTEIGQATGGLGLSYFYLGRWELGYELMRRSCDALLRCGAPTVELVTNYALGGFALRYLGRLREGQQHTEEGLRRFEAAKATFASHARFNAEMGAFDLAFQDLHLVEAWCEASQDQLSRCVVKVMHGAALLAKGEVDAAIDKLEAGRRIGREFKGRHDTYLSSVPLLARAWVLKLRAMPPDQRRAGMEELHQLCREGLRFSREQKAHLPGTLIGLGGYWMMRGKRRRGLRLLDRAQRVAEKLGARLMLADVHLERAKWLAVDGIRSEADVRRAIELYEACEANPAAAGARQWAMTMGVAVGTAPG